MADNTTLNLGSGGDVIATDDIAGVKHQLVKIEYGIADSATPVSTTNPLPVVLTGATQNVTNAGTFAVQAAATLAAETTKVIGTVNIAAAQTLATVTTVGAVTAITNALPAGTNAIGKLSANGGVTIGDVNVISQIPGTGATNLGKAEDAAHTSGDTGILAMGVRQDADASPVSATGDYQAFLFDASGNLKVNIKAGAGSGGTALADAAAFTRGTTSVTPIAAVVETSAPTLTNGNTGALSLTTAGAVRVSVASGGIAAVTEDAASAGGEDGVLCMTVRSDTVGSTTSANGDFQNLKTNATGSLWIADSDALADDSAFTPATSRVHPIGFQADETATDSVDEGDIGCPRITLDRKIIMTPYAHAAGGYTPSVTISAASTNATSLKGSAGCVGQITVSNVNAAMRYLKFYNKATAPTVGTDTPVFVVPIPGNTAGAGASITFGDAGLGFSTGIAWALTTGIAHTDTGAVSANEHVVSIAYI